METESKKDYVTREGILKLLSDAEVSRLSTAEAAAQLTPGDEYLDLEHLGRGVLRAAAPKVPMGDVLPRKAIQPATWAAILAKLPTSPAN